MTTASGDGRKSPEAQLLVVEDEPNILEPGVTQARGEEFEDVRFVLYHEQLCFRPLPPVA